MTGYLLLDVLLQAIGGLGIFLLGMKYMSEGVQFVAGPRLRKMINLATHNRFMAVGMGTLVTCMVQSSSITTVMVVGFTNIGLMNLMQAFGVIMGANIGTTITGWILVLKIGAYGLPVIGVAAFVHLLSRRDRPRYIALAILGLGMVFFGLELMKNGFQPLSEEKKFIDWFSRFSPDTYFGVLKCTAVGAILTALVQSSSATLGITIGLATAGVIDFPTAAALVLGENIGTTVTAYLASLGASDSARRASYAHILFNLIGVAWITAVFPIYIKLVIAFVGAFQGGDPNTMRLVDGVETFPLITAGIAATHSGFNIVNVLIFMALMKPMIWLLYRIVPERAGEESPHLTYFETGLVETPSLGVQQSRKEVLFMVESSTKMLDNLKLVLESSKLESQLEEKIFRREDVLDVTQKEINEFLGSLLAGSVSHEVMNEGKMQIRLADEYESVSDYIVTILKLTIKLRKDGHALAGPQLEEILDLHDKVANYMEMINEAVERNLPEVIVKARSQGDSITYLMKKYRSNHLERLGEQKATPFESLAFADILNSYRRIKDHAFNIAEVVAGEK